LPAGELVVEGSGKACGQIAQVMQRLHRQKGQMVWCEGGRQAGHAQTVNRARGMVDSNCSTKSDTKNGFQIQVKVSVFGKGPICWPRDVDSGKMGTATSLNRVGCGKQHLKSPLHAMSVVRRPQQQKIVAGSPVRKMATTVGFSFFFNGL
jgi:hypothetical protein